MSGIELGEIRFPAPDECCCRALPAVFTRVRDDQRLADPDDLARKVEWAWTHPDEMRARGREARKAYEAKYTAEKNYPILIEIYKRAIQSL